MRVHIIGTGGTIVSRPTGTGPGVVASDGAAALLAHEALTGLKQAGVQFTAEDATLINSSRLTLADLRTIVTCIDAALADDDVDGIVVTHGTDTLEETAFLADLVCDCDKPVVFTGAALSADRPDTDGPQNLVDSARFAASPQARGCGAVIAFDKVVQTARGAGKTHTLDRHTFDGGVLVASQFNETLVIHARPRRRPPLPVPGPQFDDTRADIVYTYPGATPDLLEAAFEFGADAVVLAGMGAGNAGAGFAEAIADLVASGRIIILGTRVPNGPVAGIYGNGGGADILANGAHSSGYLSVNQARILAALLVSHGHRGEQFAHLWEEYV